MHRHRRYVLLLLLSRVYLALFLHCEYHLSIQTQFKTYQCTIFLCVKLTYQNIEILSHIMNIGRGQYQADLYSVLVMMRKRSRALVIPQSVELKSITPNQIMPTTTCDLIYTAYRLRLRSISFDFFAYTSCLFLNGNVKSQFEGGRCVRFLPAFIRFRQPAFTHTGSIFKFSPSRLL